MARLLDDERGFTLIEVLCSALLVVVVSVGVLSSMDSTSRASENSRARGIAQTLTQQDQERMRGMTVAQLTAMPSTPQAKTVDGRTFQLTSTAVWSGDPDPSPPCGGDPSTTDYMRITSTVTWTGMRVKPVISRSLAAEPSSGVGGKVIVQVQDRAGTLAAGYNVHLSPSGVRTDATTSANGCVVWDNLPAGDYTVSISRVGGYVDENGRDVWSKDVTVVNDRAVAVGPVAFDKAATVKATFTTKIGAYTYVDGKTDRLTASQAGLTAQRRFGTVNSPQLSITTIQDDAHPTSVGLFPFAGAYGIYAGDCSAEDPTTYGQSIPDTVTVAPGDVNKAVVVRLPPVDTTVQYGSGTKLDGASVYYTPSNAACGSTPINMGVTGPDPANAANHGKLAFPGVPWGDYNVCAEYNVPPGTPGIPAGWYSTRKSAVQVRTAAGLTGGSAIVLDFVVNSSAVGVRCP
jgi:prepilin-type N-terminal cleavage/methylation domain-containing protein